MSKLIKGVWDLLELFCEKSHPLGVTELSNIMLEGKSLIHKRLKILEELGVIEQEFYSKKYILTTKLLELVNKSLSGYYSRTNINKYLQKLTKQTGETSLFGLKNNRNRIIYLDKYNSENLINISTNIGDSPFPHCTAHGKALLAFLDIDEIEQVAKNGFKKYTENTINNKKQLVDALKKIRELGYAEDDEERELGFRCIAAPIFDVRNNVIGAIGISGTIQRLPREKVPETAEIVKNIASKVSINIGNNIIF
ncbi:MAG TPA: hypothetical protein DCP02_04965 [Actinobacteria bacterium]|nr:hypothetical protein [Actinomycetota bacterium]